MISLSKFFSHLFNTQSGYQTPVFPDSLPVGFHFCISCVESPRHMAGWAWEGPVARTECARHLPPLDKHWTISHP